MPDDNNNQENNDENQNNNTSTTNQNLGGGKKYAVGMDSNLSSDADNLKKFADTLKACGNEVETTQIGPNQESYLSKSNAGKGKDAVIFLCAIAPVTMWSFVNAVKAGSVPHTIFGMEGWLHDPNDPDGAMADIEHVRAYDLFDEWIEEGNNATEFVQVIVEIYRVSGIIKKDTDKYF